MSQGLMTVAFGEEYQELAIYTIAHSMKFTSLPWTVLVNEPVHPKWEGLDDRVTVHAFNAKQKDNRSVKTQMCRYTPFAQTLYLDCDSVIQRTGIEEVFELLDDCNLVLNLFARWGSEKIIRLYAEHMKLVGATPPIGVYNGAFVGWNSNDSTERFFKIWSQCWRKTGRGRDMPALACAVQKSRIEVNSMRPGFFDPDTKNSKCVVQHNYDTFFKDFNLPLITRPCKPFDTSITDWTWVKWE